MRDDVGVVVASARVNVYARNTTTPIVAFDDTDANGDWAIGPGEAGDAALTAAEDRDAYDVELRNGSDRIWWNADDEVQAKTLQLWNADANEYALSVTRTEDAASVEVALFEGDRATPADNDAAYIDFRLSDSAGTQRVGARIEWIGTTILAGATGDTDLVFHALVNNVLTEFVRLDGSASELLGASGIDVNLTAASLRWASGVAVVAGEYSIQRDADGTNQLHFNVPTGATFEFSVNDVGRVVIGSTGAVFINDTANANMTGAGITIRGSGTDDQILTLKDSDVGHGFTAGFTNAETDDVAVFSKSAATTGGFRIDAFAATGVGARAFELYTVGGTANTTKTTAGRALTEITVAEGSGTGLANITADGNVFAVRAQVGGAQVARLMVDEDGDIFVVTVVDVTATGNAVAATAFDAYDDVALIRAFEKSRLPVGMIESEWDRFVEYNEGDLIHLGVLGAPVAEGGMWNLTMHTRLLNGAIWQGRKRQYEQDREIAALRSEIAELRRALPAA